MKKILIFKQEINIGGAEVAILNFAKFLNGYEVYIGYTEVNEPRLLKEIEQYAKIIDLTKETPDITFDIIISVTTKYHIIPEFRNLKYKKKYLWFHHFNDINKSVFTDLEELNNLDGIITVSKATSNKLIGMFPFLKKKLTTIYNIIDCDRVKEYANVPIQLNLAKDLNLVTTARISSDKGFLRMAALAKFLKKKNIDFKWFIIGETDEEQEKSEYLVSLFDDYKKHIEWIGFTENPHNIVKQCDYAVLLCDEETWGLVLTEAMVIGVPCISTNFEAAYEQIDNGKNGIIIRRNLLDYYEDIIDEIISKKNKYKNEVSKYNYNNDEILTQWKEFLN